MYFLFCYFTRKNRGGQSGRPEILPPCHEYEYENEYEYDYEYDYEYEYEGDFAAFRGISLHFAPPGKWGWHEVPLGFPRGEAAERSEADEGWRQVGLGMQLDEWHLLRFIPFNGTIYNF